ncbi:hypothetical protein HDU76_002314 [Blyttiomyces sp. JEL0837]|nr:hypothetical protein HDU76_002314 [Blyttiomyces sp. JEL0837]
MQHPPQQQYAAAGSSGGGSLVMGGTGRNIGGGVVGIGKVDGKVVDAGKSKVVSGNNGNAKGSIGNGNNTKTGSQAVNTSKTTTTSAPVPVNSTNTSSASSVSKTLTGGIKVTTTPVPPSQPLNQNPTTSEPIQDGTSSSGNTTTSTTTTNVVIPAKRPREKSKSTRGRGGSAVAGKIAKTAGSGSGSNVPSNTTGSPTIVNAASPSPAATVVSGGGNVNGNIGDVGKAAGGGSGNLNQGKGNGDSGGGNGGNGNVASGNPIGERDSSGGGGGNTNRQIGTTYINGIPMPVGVYHGIPIGRGNGNFINRGGGNPNGSMGRGAPSGRGSSMPRNGVQVPLHHLPPNAYQYHPYPPANGGGVRYTSVNGPSQHQHQHVQGPPHPQHVLPIPGYFAVPHSHAYAGLDYAVPMGAVPVAGVPINMNGVGSVGRGRGNNGHGVPKVGKVVGSSPRELNKAMASPSTTAVAVPNVTSTTTKATTKMVVSPNVTSTATTATAKRVSSPNATSTTTKPTEINTDTETDKIDEKAAMDSVDKLIASLQSEIATEQECTNGTYTVSSSESGRKQAREYAEAAEQARATAASMVGGWGMNVGVSPVGVPVTTGQSYQSHVPFGIGPYGIDLSGVYFTYPLTANFITSASPTSVPIPTISTPLIPSTTTAPKLKTIATPTDDNKSNEAKVESNSHNEESSTDAKSDKKLSEGGDTAKFDCNDGKGLFPGLFDYLITDIAPPKHETPSDDMLKSNRNDNSTTASQNNSAHPPVKPEDEGEIIESDKLALFFGFDGIGDESILNKPITIPSSSTTETTSSNDLEKLLQDSTSIATDPTFDWTTLSDSDKMLIALMQQSQATQPMQRQDYFYNGLGANVGMGIGMQQQQQQPQQQQNQHHPNIHFGGLEWCWQPEVSPGLAVDPLAGVNIATGGVNTMGLGIGGYNVDGTNGDTGLGSLGDQMEGVVHGSPKIVDDKTVGDGKATTPNGTTTIAGKVAGLVGACGSLPVLSAQAGPMSKSVKRTLNVQQFHVPNPHLIRSLSEDTNASSSTVTDSAMSPSMAASLPKRVRVGGIGSGNDESGKRPNGTTVAGDSVGCGVRGVESGEWSGCGIWNGVHMYQNSHSSEKPTESDRWAELVSMIPLSAAK